MEIEIFQVDAFAYQIFKGNPAPVCPLPYWLPDETLQAIAIETNQSETAFFVKNGSAYELRWFTIVKEVDLCGHATLASAFVIKNFIDKDAGKINFTTKWVGPLTVDCDGDFYTLDFPQRPPARSKTISENLIKGLGGKQPLACYETERDFMLVYPDEDAIRSIKPDYGILRSVEKWVCVTAKGKQTDFVSRFFCQDEGMEDPVTGSTHCMLVPYWAEQLGKTKLTARQLSARGGELICELKNDRVLIQGKAHLFSRGTIYLPDSLVK